MFNFKTKLQKLSFIRAEDHHDCQEINEKYIEKHHFSYSISLTIPSNEERLFNEIHSLVKDFNYFHISSLSLSQFINSDFIEGFIKKGKIYALSVKSKIDTDCTFCLLPNGTLVLNVTKEIYEELGIDGKPSQFHRLDRKKYVIKIELNDVTMRDGRKRWKRVLSRFAELDLKFDCLIMWIPDDKSICPSSISNYFSSYGFVCELGKVSRLLNKKCDAVCPNLEDVSIFADGPEVVHEWLGVVACDCEDNNEVKYSNSYSIPEPSSIIPELSYFKVIGFFPPELICSVIHLVNNHFNERAKINKYQQSWYSLTTSGFADSPIFLGLQEHGFYVSGDNAITILAYPLRSNMWCFVASGSEDILT